LSACDVNHADSKDHSAVATTSRHEDSLIKSTTKAVSYTHLDVYKRQVHGCMRRPKLTSKTSTTNV
ncbi:hypothetical protein AB723_19350, partial [Acinetobacter baumannii]